LASPPRPRGGAGHCVFNGKTLATQNFHPKIPARFRKKALAEGSGFLRGAEKKERKK
jgi:hypothetical protein